MSIELGEEWEEVPIHRWRGEDGATVPPMADTAYLRVGDEDHYYFRRAVLPDLPMAEDTVIAVVWDDAVSANHDRLIRGMGGWLDTDGAIWIESDLRSNIRSFEVKAVPAIGLPQEELHTNADVAVLLQDARKEAAASMKGAVLTAVRAVDLHCDMAAAELERGLQGIESGPWVP